MAGHVSFMFYPMIGITEQIAQKRLARVIKAAGVTAD
jgi:hypothetical protein